MIKTYKKTRKKKHTRYTAKLDHFKPSLTFFGNYVGLSNKYICFSYVRLKPHFVYDVIFWFPPHYTSMLVVNNFTFAPSSCINNCIWLHSFISMEKKITAFTVALTVEISRYIVIVNFKTVGFYFTLYYSFYVSIFPINFCQSDKRRSDLNRKWQKVLRDTSRF